MGLICQRDLIRMTTAMGQYYSSIVEAIDGENGMVDKANMVFDFVEALADYQQIKDLLEPAHQLAVRTDSASIARQLGGAWVKSIDAHCRQRGADVHPGIVDLYSYLVWLNRTNGDWVCPVTEAFSRFYLCATGYSSLREVAYADVSSTDLLATYEADTYIPGRAYDAGHVVAHATVSSLSAVGTHRGTGTITVEYVDNRGGNSQGVITLPDSPSPYETIPVLSDGRLARIMSVTNIIPGDGVSVNQLFVLPTPMSVAYPEGA